MEAFNWKHTEYFFDRASPTSRPGLGSPSTDPFQEYPSSKNTIPAYQIHEYDPCRILWMASSFALREIIHHNIPRRACLERLHLFPDQKMPDFVRRNIGNQASL